MGGQANIGDEKNMYIDDIKKIQTDEKKDSFGLKVFAIILVVCVILLCMVLGYRFGHKAVTYEGGTGKGIQTEVVIEDGDSLRVAASKLYKAGIIDDRLVFMFQARFYDYDIVPGKYILDDAMTYKEIFIELEGGGY